MNPHALDNRAALAAANPYALEYRAASVKRAAVNPYALEDRAALAAVNPHALGKPGDAMGQWVTKRRSTDPFPRVLRHWIMGNLSQVVFN